MSSNPDQIKNWFSSTEVMTQLKISGCELIHRRERGELKFKKKGNAYFYQLPESIRNENVDK